MVVIKRAVLGGGWNDEPDKDWSLLEEHEFFEQEEYEDCKKRLSGKPHYTDEMIRSMCQKTTYRLKPEVRAWLVANVEDTKEKGRKGEKGWAVGTDAYSENSWSEFTIWFYRRGDAMRFIKNWSEHEKPTTYFDYFREIRKEIDLKTRKLRVVREFTLY